MFNNSYNPVMPPHSQRELDAYNQGFEDCINKLEKTVKKLGKQYHKEFLFKLKNLGGRFSVYSTTLSNHRCNCDCCELNN